jgi:hypothetical protein
MSDRLRIDPLAVNALEAQASEAGIQEPLPLVAEGNSFLISHDQWESWIARQGRCFRWYSFADLFKAQGHDDNSSSLSVEDLQVGTVPTKDRRDAEAEFVLKYGYPESIVWVQQGLRRLLRMSSGAYWEHEATSKGHFFRQIAREEGRDIEARVANQVLADLDFRFQTIPSARFALKTTDGRQNGGGGGLLFSRDDKLTEKELDDLMRVVAKSQSHSQSPIGPNVLGDFSGIDYSLENPNAVIAYRPGGEMDRYFLNQPQNACLAASILNGAIFSGLNVTNDSRLLDQFQKKLMALQLSSDGRIDVPLITKSVDQGDIPGLTSRRVDANDVPTWVNARRPVIALVPEFDGHAFSLVGADQKRRVYRAVDTVCGMVVERAFNDPKREEKFISIEIQDFDRFLAWVTNK